MNAPEGQLWSQVAADGTDPDLLLRAVARVVGPRGDPRTVAREAAERALRGQLTIEPADDERTVLLRALAPPPTRDARAAAVDAGAAWVRLGVRAAVVGDAAYPARLAAGWPASGAPLVLSWRGPAGGLPGRPTVAIVGARRATPYGCGVAAWLAAAAADAGVLVVSGGAVGIDAAAHGAALAGTGGTAAILGCGHGVSYPHAHASPGGLFDRILDAGGWLASELPALARPHPANVLARNRIVAGLADAVVVVEGGQRSGSLRTAACAAERGVTVLAVPGDVRAPGSAAPHQLLVEGAAPCTAPRDLLDALRVAEPSDDGVPESTPSALPPQVRAILERSWPRPVRAADLAREAEVEVARLLGALTRARIAGEVAESLEGVRLTRAPRSSPRA